MTCNDESIHPTAVTDKQQLDAYEATSGKPGDAVGDSLFAATQRRDLDV